MSRTIYFAFTDFDKHVDLGFINSENLVVQKFTKGDIRSNGKTVPDSCTAADSNVNRGADSKVFSRRDRNSETGRTAIATFPSPPEIRAVRGRSIRG